MGFVILDDPSVATAVLLMRRHDDHDSTAESSTSGGFDSAGKQNVCADESTGPRAGGVAHVPDSANRRQPVH